MGTTILNSQLSINSQLIMHVEYDTVIGLEIHIQLNTNTKAFCSDINGSENEPNIQISPISMAHPGTLPKLNLNHWKKAIKLGIALGCDVNEYHYFDRKNYFYPDLPKGYQITQDKIPFCSNGKISYFSENEVKTIRLHHIHMEEDAGKLIHNLDDSNTFLDINRAGSPLLEIVTLPEFSSGQEVSDFLAELQKTVQFLDISNANMESGEFRCDCNVSVKVKGSQILGERCEIKNQNSRKFAKAAIEYEAKRQINILNAGGKIVNETMLFDPNTGETRSMRKKESVNDYRYFPEPDLPPMFISKEMIDNLKSDISILPVEAIIKLKNQYQLSVQDAMVLTEDIVTTNFCLQLLKTTKDAKEMTDLLILKLIPYCKSENISVNKLKSPQELDEWVDFIKSGKSSKSAVYQQVFPEWIESQETSENIALRLGLIKSENQNFLDEIISKVLSENQSKVKEYNAGKKGLIGFFTGLVIKHAGGSADPKVVKEKLESALSKSI